MCYADDFEKIKDFIMIYQDFFFFLHFYAKVHPNMEVLLLYKHAHIVLELHLSFLCGV